jgi:hypothetical protein
VSGKPQIKLAAVRVGDLLKYSTTINEINRTASSIFSFACDSFPIEGVTSQRAKLIFDWLMTLFKQATTDAEKRDLARMFLTNITPEAERPQIFQVLVDTSILAADQNPTIATAAVETSAEAEFLRRVFQPALLHRLPLSVQLSAALTARVSEAQACIEAKAYLAAVILAGSVLEGLCLGYGSRMPERTNRAYTQQYKKPSPPFHAWKLREWIDVLGHLGDLSPNVEKFGHELRDFRNFVHPAEQLAHRFMPDHHTARIGLQVVVAALEDLVRACEKQKDAAP